MAILTPQKTLNFGGVSVSQYILPAKKRTGRMLNTDGHKPTSITIHNTDMITTASNTTPAEQYTRSTVNGNMGEVVVHFYVDSKSCWQNLYLDEQGVHSGDGISGKTGNTTSIAIECIETNGTTADDKITEQKAAQLTAWLLYKYDLPLSAVRTHQSWSGKKCPIYILPHWNTFLAQVQTYLDKLKTTAKTTTTTTTKSGTYQIVAGSFTDKSNAEAYQKKLKEKGFDSFLQFKES